MEYLGFPGGLRLTLATGTFRTAEGRLWEPTPRGYMDVAVPVVSRIVRFSGHCPGLTVAAHSVLVTELGRAQGFSSGVLAALAAHDLHEAFVGDVPEPTKQWLRAYTNVLDVLHQRVEEHKHRVFCVMPNADVLRHLDKRAAELEAAWFGIDLGYSVSNAQGSERDAASVVFSALDSPGASEYFAKLLYEYILD